MLRNHVYDFVSLCCLKLVFESIIFLRILLEIKSIILTEGCIDQLCIFVHNRSLKACSQYFLSTHLVILFTSANTHSLKSTLNRRFNKLLVVNNNLFTVFYQMPAERQSSNEIFLCHTLFW